MINQSARAPSEPAAVTPKFHFAHHFDSAQTQFEANKLGIWLFLVTEVLLFGGLFGAFAVFRSWYLPAFVEAHHHLDKVMGSVNTVVLICSSLTMALAVRSSQQSKKGSTAFFLASTIALACTFLVIKYFEYSHKIEHGLLPGKLWHAEGFVYPQAKIFFGLYFMMTGIHGLHVLIGIGLIGWAFLRNSRSEFSSSYYAPVEGVGLYWHLVDLIWIYLFPLLYLIG